MCANNHNFMHAFPSLFFPLSKHTYHILLSYTVNDDYGGTIMTITLRGGGEEFQDIMIPITNDNIVEPTEDFSLQFLVLGDSDNIISYQPAMATIQIIDDDSKCSSYF